MAFAPGPRNKAAQIAANPFVTEAPWAANTAYGMGATFSNGGNTYSAPVAFTSGATFSATGLTLVAQGGAAGAAGAAGATGATGAAAPALSFPFTTDATNLTYTITHNLNTRAIKAQVQDLNDSNAEVPGLDYTYPTVNTCVVGFGAAPGTATNLVLAII